MKPVIFAIVAMMCYAVSNVLLETKFSKFNNLTLMVCYGAVIWVTAFVVRQVTKTTDSSFDFPKGNMFWLVMLLGIIFALADYFYVGAYTNGGDLLTVTCITVMFPVFASLIKFGITRSVPNSWQITGYLLAVVAILAISKGGQLAK
jgi:drug/metabolite transporter (DMT)-like permease